MGKKKLAERISTPRAYSLRNTCRNKGGTTTRVWIPTQGACQDPYVEIQAALRFALKAFDGVNGRAATCEAGELLVAATRPGAMYLKLTQDGVSA